MKKFILVTLILACAGQVTKAQTLNAAAVKHSSFNGSSLEQTFAKTAKPGLEEKFKNGFSPVETTNYLKKSRNQKTAAWVMMGTGFAALVTGIIVEISNAQKNTDELFFGDQNTDNTGIDIAIAGGGLMIGSIPLFVASSRNKNKASLTIKNEKTGFGVPPNVSKNITGITMRVEISHHAPFLPPPRIN